MKKIVSAFCLVFASSLFVFAQKEANVWYFGTYAGLDFGSGSPVVVNNSGMSTIEGCASIADKSTGQILFYTNGMSIYNKNNVVMTNGAGLLGDSSSTQSGVIVPKPGSSNLYYVFTADAEVGYSSFNQGKFCYNVVDMSLNGGLGGVTVKNQVLKTNMVEKIAAVRACNGQDIWVIAHEWGSRAFYAYKVTSAGISAPVITTVGINHTDVDFQYNMESIGYMKASPDGKKLALACYNASNTVQIFDFDNSTGVVSNPITDTNFPDQTIFGDYLGGDGPYGLSFSPDNSRLYVGVYGSYTYLGISYIYQYNMKAGSNAAILASRTTIKTNYSESYGALQIGPDGKIYVAKSNDIGSNYLDVINNPNALGTACNYVANSLFLGNVGSSVFGLPDLIESYLSVPITATLTYTDCSGNHTLSFTDNSLNGTINTSWDFGDPASGAANTSNLQNPAHTFSSSGTYTVTCYFTTVCQVDSFKQTVTASGGSSATASPQDTTLCSGNYVQLHATGGDTYEWSPSTGIQGNDTTNPDPYVIPLSTTTYTVTATKGGCTSIATATVHVAQSPPVPNISQSHDTLYCSYDPSYAHYQWYDSATVIPGAVDSFVVVTHSGNYNVSVSNKDSCSVAVGINVILTTGLNDNTYNASIVLTPNPATDAIVINGSLFNGKILMTIYNVLGEKVYSEPLMTTNNNIQTTIDISRFSKGVYMLKIQQADNTRNCWVEKFVKE